MRRLAVRSRPGEGPLDLVERTVSHTRTVAASLTIAALVLQRPPAMSPLEALIVGAVVAGFLLGSTRMSRRVLSLADGARAARLVNLQLVLDLAAATLVVVVVRPNARSLAWALLVLPVLEAALRYRLVGLAAAWSVLVGAMMVRTARVWQPTYGLRTLQELTRPFVLVLLAALPAGYLADRLVAEIDRQRGLARDATTRATLVSALERSGAGLARALNPVEVYDRTAATAVELGFPAAEVWVRRATEEGWQRMAEAVGAETLALPHRPPDGSLPLGPEPLVVAACAAEPSGWPGADEPTDEPSVDEAGFGDDGDPLPAAPFDWQVDPDTAVDDVEVLVLLSEGDDHLAVLRAWSLGEHEWAPRMEALAVLASQARSARLLWRRRRTADERAEPVTASPDAPPAPDHPTPHPVAAA